MKLALVQMRIEPGEAEPNLARAAEMTAQAAAAGAQLALLPEALPFGWMDPSARQGAEAIPEGRHFRVLAGLAARHRIHLCAGLAERDGERVFNAAVLISPRGELLLRHRKIHELAIAHDCYALGDRAGVADTELGRLGLMICADGFAPGQAISRTLCLMGAEVILSPCAWAVPPGHDPNVTPYGQLWLDNYGAVTREFGCWIAGCSNVGPVRSGAWAGHRCIGCSMVVGPGGREIARASYGENAEEILLVDLFPAPLPRTAAD